MSDNTTPPDALAAVRERLADLDRQIAVLEARRDEARGLLELLSQTARRKPGPKPGWKNTPLNSRDYEGDMETANRAIAEGRVYNAVDGTYSDGKP